MKELILGVLLAIFCSACTSEDSKIDLKPECLNAYAEKILMNTDKNQDSKISKYRAIDVLPNIG
jgi:hypothetical protein